MILNNGDLAVSAGGGLVQASNSVLFTGTGNMNLQGGAGVQLGQLVTNGGAVTIASSLGPVVVDAPIVGTGSTGRAGTLTVEGKGITLNGGRVGDFTLTNSADTRPLQLRDTLDAAGAGRVSSAGAVSLANITAAGFTLGGLAGAGSAADRLNLSGSLASTASVELRTVNGMTLTDMGGVTANGTLRMVAGGVLNTAAGSAIVTSGPARITAAALSLNGGLQADGNDSSVLTATAGGIALGDTAAVKVVGSSALIFDGTGFVQATGAKTQSGAGGTIIRAGNGNLSASSLVSTGAVSLSGADVSVSQFIGGPGTAPASALTVESAGQSTLAGGRFSGAVDITASTHGTPLPDWSYIRSGKTPGQIADVAENATQTLAQASALASCSPAPCRRAARYAWPRTATPACKRSKRPRSTWRIPWLRPPAAPAATWRCAATSTAPAARASG